MLFSQQRLKTNLLKLLSINISNRNDLQAARLGNNFRLDTSMLCAGQVIIQSSCVKTDLKIEIWSMYDSSGEF